MALKYYVFHCYACRNYIHGLSSAQANKSRLTCPVCSRSNNYETFWECTCGRHVERGEYCCGSTDPSDYSLKFWKKLINQIKIPKPLTESISDYELIFNIK